jgi:hypothetical protein
MKIQNGIVIIAAMFLSCAEKKDSGVAKNPSVPIVGTWKLVNGTVIEKGDTTHTEYTKKISFIKVINDTHFAFLQHDLNKGKDSSAVFSAGGGRYSLKDSVYTEQLEYCTAREWEGNSFKLTVSIRNDTLIQRGVEKLEGLGVDRINVEKYIRVK